MVIVRINRIAFIGFGEAATAFILSWHNKSPEIINAFDLKTNSPKTREQKLLEYIEHGVQGTFHPQDAIDGTQIIFSLVTADQAEAARTRTRTEGSGSCCESYGVLHLPGIDAEETTPGARPERHL